MQLPPQITIKDIPHSPALETRILNKITKLNSLFPRIMACRVVIEAPQKHRHQGKLYNVRMDLTVPGEEVAVTRNIDQNIYIAVREAFYDAKRKLDEYTERQKGDGKADHAKIPLRGRVVRVFSHLGYGFIETDDGHEVYFNQCVVRPNYQFKHLAEGIPVHFLEEMGNKGPQASRVRLSEDDY